MYSLGYRLLYTFQNTLQTRLIHDLTFDQQRDIRLRLFIPKKKKQNAIS